MASLKLPTHAVHACPNCTLGTSMPRAPWICKACGATGSGGNLASTKPKTDRVYICQWSIDDDEHEHGAYGVGCCKVCGLCATCRLSKSYHTKGGADECVNALAKRVDELQGLINVAEIVSKTTCRCGRIATEHECGECYGI